MSWKKIQLDSVVCSVYFVYKIQIFPQLMKGLGYLLKTKTQYFESTMQKERVKIVLKVFILNFELCHME